MTENVITEPNNTSQEFDKIKKEEISDNEKPC
jgi:hypothetical protein